MSLVSEFGRKSVQQHIFLPSTPLGELLITNAHDVDSLADNTVTLGDTVYILSPVTGEYVPYTTLQAKPANSDGSITAPLQTAEAIMRILKRYGGCPVPIQIRSYTCDAPGKSPEAWTALMHVRLAQFNQASFANLTANGPDANDGTPSTTVSFRHQGIDFLDKSVAGYYERTTPVTQDAFSLVYADSPGCGDCSGGATDGCQILVGVWVGQMQISTDGGATWAAAASPPSIAGGGWLVEHNGRVVLATGTTISYADDPNGSWVAANMPAGVSSLGRMASNGDKIFAIYNTNGVLYSDDNGQNFAVAMSAGTISAEVFNDISADGSVVGIAAANNDFVISTDNGAVWALKAGPGAATDDHMAVAVANWNLESEQAAVIYLVNDDGTDRVVYKSGDEGDNWTAVYTNAGATSATKRAFLGTAMDGWVVYYHDSGDGTTAKSVSGGSSMFDISNTNVDITQQQAFANCPHDPNAVFVIGNQPI